MTLTATRPQQSRSVLPTDNRPQATVKVCFLIDNLSRAGTETQLLALIRTLDRRRVEPLLVLLDGENEASRMLEPADCPVLRLGVGKLIGRRAVAAAGQFRAFLRHHRPDVLQAYFLDSAYFGVPLARWCGVRKILRVRNNLGYWLTLKHRVLNKFIGRWVDATITNSDEGAAALVGREGVPADRVTVLGNGVDLDRFAGGPPPFTNGAAVRVGCVANLRPVKNVDGLVRAAKVVNARFPDVRFEVAGDGPDRAELERRIAAVGLGQRVTLRGAVADVPGFLRGLDVAVLPSHSEGMSNAVLEYMAAGRAVVATAVGANPRLVRAGVDGWIVPPGDDAALAAAISGAIADPVTARRFAASARERAEAEFGREAMRRRFEAFYLALLGHLPRP